MGAVIGVVVMATLFLVAAIFLFRGKCSWLIAGYNTASKEEKAKYNEKKLCVTVGYLTVVVAILLYVMAFLCYLVEKGQLAENALVPFAIVFVAVVLGTAIFEIIYTNTACKK